MADKGAAVTDDALDAITAGLGSSGVLDIFTGAKPATAATADSGTLIFTTNLDATPFNAASADTNRSKTTMNSLPKSDSVIGAGGTAGYWRLRTVSAGGVVVAQGTISTVAAGTGELQFDDIVFTTGGTVNINTFDMYLDY